MDDERASYAVTMISGRTCIVCQCDASEGSCYHELSEEEVRRVHSKAKTLGVQVELTRYERFDPITKR
jgi:hypothetical protein